MQSSSELSAPNYAELAGVASALMIGLKYVARGQPYPGFARTELRQGINFLHEAVSGGAFFIGRPLSHGSFSGRLGPIWLAVDNFSDARVAAPPTDYRNVLERLEPSLELLRAVDRGEAISTENRRTLEDTILFFDSLADLLLGASQGLTRLRSRAMNPPGTAQ